MRIRWTPAAVAVLVVCTGAAEAVGEAAGTDDRGGVPLVVEIASQPAGVLPPGPQPTVRVRNDSGRVIVAYGLELWQRDRRARPRLVQTFRVRPRQPLRPGQVSSEPLPVFDVPGAQVRPVFAINPSPSRVPVGWPGPGRRGRERSTSGSFERWRPRSNGPMAARPNTSRGKCAIASIARWPSSHR